MIYIPFFSHIIFLINLCDFLFFSPYYLSGVFGPSYRYFLFVIWMSYIVVIFILTYLKMRMEETMDRVNTLMQGNVTSAEEDTEGNDDYCEVEEIPE